MKAATLWALALSTVAVTARADWPLRTWTDSTGKHTIEARFGGIMRETVTLEPTDGKRIKLLLVRLSKVDQEYIADIKSGKVNKEKPTVAVESERPTRPDTPAWADYHKAVETLELAKAAKIDTKRATDQELRPGVPNATAVYDKSALSYVFRSTEDKEKYIDYVRALIAEAEAKALSWEKRSASIAEKMSAFHNDVSLLEAKGKELAGLLHSEHLPPMSAWKRGMVGTLPYGLTFVGDHRTNSRLSVGQIDAKSVKAREKVLEVVDSMKKIATSIRELESDMSYHERKTMLPAIKERFDDVLAVGEILKVWNSKYDGDKFRDFVIEGGLAAANGDRLEIHTKVEVVGFDEYTTVTGATRRLWKVRLIGDEAPEAPKPKDKSA